MEQLHNANFYAGWQVQTGTHTYLCVCVCVCLTKAVSGGFRPLFHISQGRTPLSCLPFLRLTAESWMAEWSGVDWGGVGAELPSCSLGISTPASAGLTGGEEAETRHQIRLASGGFLLCCCTTLQQTSVPSRTLSPPT